MPFVCFMVPPAMKRLLSLLVASFMKLWSSVEHYVCFECKWKAKKNVYLCRVNCKEVHSYSLFWQFCQKCRSHCCLTMQANSLCPVFCPPPPNTKAFNPHKLGTRGFNRTALRMSLFSNTVMITIHPMRKCSSFSGCETISCFFLFRSLDIKVSVEKVLVENSTHNTKD